MRRIVDLSHSVRDGTVTYRGLPPPRVSEFLTREASEPLYGAETSSFIGKIEMVGNTGTYLDSPFHRFSDGKDLPDLPLERLALLDAVVIRIRKPEIRSLESADFDGIDVKGRAVLIHTRWAERWGTERYFEEHAFLSQSAAEFLRDKGAVLVGIDSLNIDDTRDPLRCAHSILLGAEIPIVEHLCRLEQIPRFGALFTAVPPNVRGIGSFSVRAFASYEEGPNVVF